MRTPSIPPGLRGATTVGTGLGLVISIPTAVATDSILTAALAGLFVAALGTGVVYVVRTVRSILHNTADLQRLLTGDLYRLIVLAGGGPWLPGFDIWTLEPRHLTTLLDLIIVNRPETIVELGPGISTQFLLMMRKQSGLAYHVVAVEESPTHARRLESHLNGLAADDDVFELHIAPLEMKDGQTWYKRSVLSQLPASIDLLIIDGPKNHDQQHRRDAALDFLATSLAPGGLVCIDDADRSDERGMVDMWLASSEYELEADSGDYVILRRSGRETGTHSTVPASP